MRRRRLVQFGLIAAAVVAFPFVAPVACTQPDRAREVLEIQGYSDIEISGYAYLACGNGDVFATAFEATSPSGQAVEGAVCSGIFKGNTVRLD
ncbi:hypothetical protein NAP1_13933 [Erythrobacter sp. NAP1]|uniref:hypothetical protein n=1 Tax=Erythrobacter sp. NAP1 TaxID=237727 RepID=UPI00006876B9|nr:hypothetical protein [Erythrobacter sp. NAP1]EAQ28704.1 hypothetical protein NAP1_13933 [Erythrobacter sp. NAP1]